MPISATKPSADGAADGPRWATDGGADVVEPVSGKKDSGWVDAEEPPAEYFNWLARVTYEWQQYLEDATDQLNTTKAELAGNTFTGNQVPNATGLDLGSAAARWDAHLEAVTVYGSVLPNATGVDVGSSGARFDAFLRDTDISGTCSLNSMASTNDPTAANQLHRESTVKVFASLKIDGGGGGTITNQNSFNVDGTPTIGTNGLGHKYVDIQFVSVFSDSFCCPSIQIIDGAGLDPVQIPVIESRGASSIRVKFFNDSINDWQDLTAFTNDFIFTITIAGRQ